MAVRAFCFGAAATSIQWFTLSFQIISKPYNRHHANPRRHPHRTSHPPAARRYRKRRLPGR
ncbi:hypothetical protein CNECB9_5300013 [Cupriavidus necator]|uniref:Uncharacterized protein n=1 Tax=Cupriavidus necator TaxID=106590 RepID=A0A1K0JNC3_CUPNE|nr:hypothetical protein CNECB9_5300013 [Cupriavidus necator]